MAETDVRNTVMPGRSNSIGFSPEIEQEIMVTADIILSFQDGTKLKAHKAVLFAASNTLRRLYAPASGEACPATGRPLVDDAVIAFPAEEAPDAWRVVLRMIYPVPDAQKDVRGLFTLHEIERAYRLAHRYDMQCVMQLCRTHLKYRVDLGLDVNKEDCLFKWLFLAIDYNDNLMKEELLSQLDGVLPTLNESFKVDREHPIWQGGPYAEMYGFLLSHLSERVEALAHAREALEESGFSVAPAHNTVRAEYGSKTYLNDLLLVANKSTCKWIRK